MQHTLWKHSIIISCDIFILLIFLIYHHRDSVGLKFFGSLKKFDRFGEFK